MIRPSFIHAMFLVVYLPYVHEIVIVLFLTNVQHNVANNSLSSALIFLFDFDFSPGSGRSHQYREPDEMDVYNWSNTLASQHNWA